jgi:hypothetical protein
MKLAHKVDEWIESFKKVFSEVNPRHIVTTSAFAWHLFHYLGWYRIYYEDDTVTDKHVETALKKVFPNAVFK